MQYEIEQANRLGNRAVNQDRFSAIETDEGVLLILADGMGGHAAGELAAQALVDVARREYLRAERPITETEAFFRHVVQKAHIIVRELGRSENLPTIPGTTAVLCLVQDSYAHWAHVGDSRLYLFRDGRLLERTTDHSYVERLYRRGAISLAQKATHPRRNHITQCIGYQSRQPKIAYSAGHQLVQGDILLLCSDGLWSALGDEEIGRQLSHGLLDLALQSMSAEAERKSYPRSDNISVLGFRLITPLSAVEGDLDPEVGNRNGQQGGDHHRHEDLRSAIAEIERAIHEYEREMHD